jgi:DNA mismatch repair protein MutS
MPLSPATPPAQPATHTPAIAEYLGIKACHPNTLLLYRMGDYYEAFFKDAAKVARLLDLTLTQRTPLHGDPIPMAGVPYHALEGYVAHLTSLGESVAISEPISRGSVERELRLVTPDALQDSELPEDSTEAVLSPVQ